MCGYLSEDDDSGAEKIKIKIKYQMRRACFARSRFEATAAAPPPPPPHSSFLLRALWMPAGIPRAFARLLLLSRNNYTLPHSGSITGRRERGGGGGQPPGLSRPPPLHPERIVLPLQHVSPSNMKFWRTCLPRVDPWKGGILQKFSSWRHFDQET